MARDVASYISPPTSIRVVMNLGQHRSRWLLVVVSIVSIHAVIGGTTSTDASSSLTQTTIDHATATRTSATTTVGPPTPATVTSTIVHTQTTIQYANAAAPDGWVDVGCFDRNFMELPSTYTDVIDTDAVATRGQALCVAACMGKNGPIGVYQVSNGKLRCYCELHVDQSHPIAGCEACTGAVGELCGNSYATTAAYVPIVSTVTVTQAATQTLVYTSTVLTSDIPRTTTSISLATRTVTETKSILTTTTATHTQTVTDTTHGNDDKGNRE